MDHAVTQLTKRLVTRTHEVPCGSAQVACPAMSIDPDTLANLDPDDGSSHVDAIRELATAVADLQFRLISLEGDVSDLEGKVN